MCGGCGMPYVTNGERSTTIIEIDVQAHKRRIRFVRAGVGRATALTRPGKSPRPHRTGCSPYALRHHCVGARVIRRLCLPSASEQGREVAGPAGPADGRRYAGQQRVAVRAVVRVAGTSHPRSPAPGGNSPRRRDQLENPVAETGGPLRPRLAVDLGHRGCGVLPASIPRAAPRRRPSYSARPLPIPFWSATAIAPTRSWPASSRVVWFGVVLESPKARIDCAAGQVELAQWCETWLGDIAGIYRLNKKRLSHYKPGLEQQDESFEAAQRALESGIERLFATATQQLSARHKTAREAKPLRSLLNHREGLSVFLQRPAGADGQ